MFVRTRHRSRWPQRVGTWTTVILFALALGLVYLIAHFTLKSW